MKATILNHLVYITYKPLNSFTNWGDTFHSDYKVTIKHNGKISTFKYSAEVGKEELNNSDLLTALHCFVSDGISYAENNTFEKFAYTFGYYESETAKTKKAFLGCMQHYNSFLRVFPNVDIYKIYEELNDIINN